MSFARKRPAPLKPLFTATQIGLAGKAFGDAAVQVLSKTGGEKSPPPSPDGHSFLKTLGDIGLAAGDAALDVLSKKGGGDDEFEHVVVRDNEPKAVSALEAEFPAMPHRRDAGAGARSTTSKLMSRSFVAVVKGVEVAPAAAAASAASIESKISSTAPEAAAPAVTVKPETTVTPAATATAASAASATPSTSTLWNVLSTVASYANPFSYSFSIWKTTPSAATTATPAAAPADENKSAPGLK